MSERRSSISSSWKQVPEGEAGVLRRIISRVRNTFNVSVAEVDSRITETGVIGFAVVGNETPFVSP